MPLIKQVAQGLITTSHRLSSTLNISKFHELYCLLGCRIQKADVKADVGKSSALINLLSLI